MPVRIKTAGISYSSLLVFRQDLQDKQDILKSCLSLILNKTCVLLITQIL